MSVTTPTVHVPDTTDSVPGWLRRHLAWMLVAVAVLATAVLVTLTVVDGDSEIDVARHGQLVDQGSINAIEHRGRTAPPAADSLLDRSINAIDRTGR